MLSSEEAGWLVRPPVLRADVRQSGWPARSAPLPPGYPPIARPSIPAARFAAAASESSAGLPRSRHLELEPQARSSQFPAAPTPLASPCSARHVRVTTQQARKCGTSYQSPRDLTGRSLLAGRSRPALRSTAPAIAICPSKWCAAPALKATNLRLLGGGRYYRRPRYASAGRLLPGQPWCRIGPEGTVKFL